MGRSVRAVKRRGGPNKVTRQSKTRKGRVHIENQTVKAAWDFSKTLRENYSALGLQVNPNDRVRHDAQPMIDLHVGEEKEKAPTHFSFDEQRTFLALTRRHGSDYAAMARDLKLNPYQHTAKQLRKRVGKWKRLAGVDEESNDDGDDDNNNDNDNDNDNDNNNNNNNNKHSNKKQPKRTATRTTTPTTTSATTTLTPTTPTKKKKAATSSKKSPGASAELARKRAQLPDDW